MTKDEAEKMMALQNAGYVIYLSTGPYVNSAVSGRLSYNDDSQIQYDDDTYCDVLLESHSTHDFDALKRVNLQKLLTKGSGVV